MCVCVCVCVCVHSLEGALQHSNISNMHSRGLPTEPIDPVTKLSNNIYVRISMFDNYRVFCPKKVGLERVEAHLSKAKGKLILNNMYLLCLEIIPLTLKTDLKVDMCTYNVHSKF